MTYRRHGVILAERRVEQLREDEEMIRGAKASVVKESS
jgi:hypothetical protein